MVLRERGPVCRDMFCFFATTSKCQFVSSALVLASSSVPNVHALQADTHEKKRYKSKILPNKFHSFIGGSELRRKKRRKHVCFESHKMRKLRDTQEIRFLKIHFFLSNSSIWGQGTEMLQML